MGKVEIGIYFYVTVDILTEVYRNVPGVALYQPYEILSKSLILIGFYGKG